MGIFAYGTWQQVAYAPVLAAGLAIIGMGMGCTFMTLSAAAVQTLKTEQVARGSTLINVSQRLGGSIGTALTSVILTNQFNRSPNVAAANKLAALHDEATKRGVPVPRSAMPPHALSPDFVHNVMHDLSHAYTVVFLTVAVLVALTYIPAVFLPKRPVQEAAGPTAAPAADIAEHRPRVGTARVDPAGWQRDAGAGPGSGPVFRQYTLPPAVGWRARFTGTGEPGASFDGAGRVDAAEQQRWVGTYRVDRQGWEQPGAGPVYRQSAPLPAVGWRARFRGIREAVAGMGRVGAIHDGRA
jgi:hypothetical protein